MIENLGRISIQSMEFYSLTLFQNILSVATSTLAVLFLSLPLVALGHRITRLLGYKAIPAFPSSLAYGLSAVLFLAYYAGLAHASLTIVFCIVIVAGLGVLAYDVYSNFHQNRRAWLPPHEFWSLVLFSLVFFSLNLLTLNSSEVAPGVVGNNDVYFWAASADQLLGRFNFSNILPLGEATWNSNLREDSNGTYLTIALTAVQLSRSAFEATPLFMGAVISWTGMIIAELVVFMFGVRRSTSLIVAVIVVCGSFFHYISYNFFAGQIVATFAFLSLLHAGLVIYSDNSRQSILRIALKLLPLLSLLLISYQSGFIVFFSAVLLYILIISSSSSVSRLDLVAHVKLVLSSMILGLAFAFLSYPLVIGHLYRTTLYVHHVKAGWEMPFLSVFSLFSLPSPFPLSPISPLLSNPPLSKLSLVVAVVIMLALIRTITRNPDRYSLHNIKLIWLSGIVFVVALVGYVLAHTAKGNAYQVWKFAAFTVMPITFIPISIIAIWLLGIFPGKDKSHEKYPNVNGRWRAARERVLPAARPVMLGAALMSVIACLIISCYKSGGTSDRAVFKDLKDISGHLQGARTVILDLPPYRETLIAFNVLSRNYTLVPLSESYLPKAEVRSSDYGRETKWVTTNRCAQMLQNGMRPRSEMKNRSQNGYAVFGDLLEVGGSVVGGFDFGSGGGACLLGNSFTVTKGLSGPERFGRWSDGKEVELRFRVPEALRGRDLRLAFNISPFLAGSIHSQEVTPYVDGHKSSGTKFSKPGLLLVKLSKQDTNKDSVSLVLEISDPVRPSDSKAGSDTRLLGIAFENMIIEIVR